MRLPIVRNLIRTGQKLCSNLLACVVKPLPRWSGARDDGIHQQGGAAATAHARFAIHQLTRLRPRHLLSHEKQQLPIVLARMTQQTAELRQHSSALA